MKKVEINEKNTLKTDLSPLAMQLHNNSKIKILYYRLTQQLCD